MGLTPIGPKFLIALVFLNPVLADLSFPTCEESCQANSDELPNDSQLEAQETQEALDALGVNLLQSAFSLGRQQASRGRKPRRSSSPKDLVSAGSHGEEEEDEEDPDAGVGLEDWSFARVAELQAPADFERHRSRSGDGKANANQDHAKAHRPVSIDGADAFPVQEQAGLATLYTNSQDSSFFAMDITDLVEAPSTAQVVVSAMAARGVHDDAVGQVVTMHEPLENTENTILGFRRSLDNGSVAVLQPQMGLRTSDEDSELAFSVGASRPLVANLQPLTSLPEPFSSRATSDRVIINGFDLVQNGFFVSGTATGTARLIRAVAYPRNIVVTALFSSRGQPLIVTFSMMALPERLMAPRPGDARLGYFATDYVDLGMHEPGLNEATSEAVDRSVSMIWRYDLPALPDRQLKVYVDPSVPMRYRQVFKEGIEAWNVAFDPIGFPNALRAVLPTDADWPEDYDAGDGRFTSVAWCIDRSSVYAMGIAKVDPRTGEILHGAVIFGDGWVQSHLQDLERLAPTMHLPSGYRREEFPAVPSGDRRTLEEHEASGSMAALLQHRLNDTQTTQMDVIGDALRDVVTHEIGHLLGLRHNFKGSAGVSWECTQDRACSAIHGLTTSVMDYLPMNVPSANVSNVHLFTPIVGAYDRLAIRYGYHEPPAGAAEDSPENLAQLGRVLEEAEALPVCTDGNLRGREDPLCAQHDLGGDPVLFYEDQLALVRDSLREAFATAVLPGSSYGKFGDVVLGLMGQTRRVAQGLSRFIGGVNVTFAHRHRDGAHRPEAKQATDGGQQRHAFQLLLRLLRPHHHGLLPPLWTESFLVETQGDGVSAVDLRPRIIALQSLVIGYLLDGVRVSKVCMQPHGSSGFGCAELLDGVLDEVFGIEGGSDANISDTRDWDMQRAWTQHLQSLRSDESLSEEVAAYVDTHVHRAHAMISSALEKKSVPLGEAHLLLLQRKLQGEEDAIVGLLHSGSLTIRLQLFAFVLWISSVSCW